MVAWNTLGLHTNCHCFQPLRCRYKAVMPYIYISKVENSGTCATHAGCGENPPNEGSLGILSTSWVFCENTFSRMRSTSLLSLESLQYRIHVGLQTNCAATVFNLGDV